jgi:hypothetical protein
MTLDNPRTRSGFTCPICLGPKDRGLVACWYCFKTSGLKQCAPRAEKIVADFEAFLESQEQRT